MHTFAKRPKATQQTTFAEAATPCRGNLRQSPEGKSSLRFGHDFGRIPIRPPTAGLIQTKLASDERGDGYEQEADRMAEQVMRTSGPEPRGACACGGECCKGRGEQSGTANRLMRSGGAPADVATTATAAPPEVHEVLRTPGQSMDSATRGFFEPRFGTEFGSVRIHADTAAAESARTVYARAYTVGNHIVFAGGEYAPETPAGRRLLAHELTHVTQQRAAGAATLNRKPEDDDWLSKQKEEIKTWLTEISNKPGPPSVWPQPGCPANFCQPFADKAQAASDLEEAGKWLLFGILLKMGPKVSSLWMDYLRGGSDMQDLTAKGFAEDFTNAPSTALTTDLLLGEARKDVEANQAASRPLDQDLPRYGAALDGINTPGDAREMWFGFADGVPGNLAGGVGRDQLANPIGAKPSPVNDVRAADLKLTLSPNPDGSTTVTPSLEFVVQDTIDLCPGQCGSGNADVLLATTLLSRFEATGLTGDVPFVIRFPAPKAKLVPFVVGRPRSPLDGTWPTP